MVYFASFLPISRLPITSFATVPRRTGQSHQNLRAIPVFPGILHPAIAEGSVGSKSTSLTGYHPLNAPFPPVFLVRNNGFYRLQRYTFFLNFQFSLPIFPSSPLPPISLFPTTPSQSFLRPKAVPSPSLCRSHFSAPFPLHIRSFSAICIGKVNLTYSIFRADTRRAHRKQSMDITVFQYIYGRPPGQARHGGGQNSTCWSPAVLYLPRCW